VGVFVCKFLACVLGTSCVFGSSSKNFNKLQTVLRVYTEVCAMAVAYASASSAVGKQRRPAPRRGQVKAAIAASWLNALTSIVHGARSVALSRSHSRWSFRSS
jgi:hypothetical protein